MQTKNPTNLESGIRIGVLVLILLLAIVSVVAFFKWIVISIFSLLGVIFSSTWVWIIVAIIIILLLVWKYKPSLPSTNKWFGTLVKIALAILAIWIVVCLCKYAWEYCHSSHDHTEVKNRLPLSEKPLSFGLHYLDKEIWYKTTISSEKLCYVVTKLHSTQIEEKKDHGCWFIRAANQADSVVINKDPLPVP